MTELEWELARRLELNVRIRIAFVVEMSEQDICIKMEENICDPGGMMMDEGC